MIRIDQNDEDRLPIAGLRTGSVAYVDADWIAGRPNDVPAVIVGQGTIQRTGGRSFPIPAGADPDTVAASALFEVARSAATACQAAAGWPIEVKGNGVIAGAIRELNGGSAPESGGRPDDDRAPAVIVDCTGDPSHLADATRRLADGGTLLLAGEPLGRPIDIDLYPDVHKRCLSLVGIPRPLGDDGDGPSANPVDEATLDMFRRTLVVVPRGAAVPAEGAWYRLLAGDPLE